MMVKHRAYTAYLNGFPFLVDHRKSFESLLEETDKLPCLERRQRVPNVNKRCNEKNIPAEKNKFGLSLVKHYL